MSKTLAFRDRVASYFTARPGVWIPAADFEAVGGRQAWRTRISDCRRELGMTIENRVLVGVINGHQWRRSEYRYVPPVERERGSDPQGHNLNSRIEGSLF